MRTANVVPTFYGVEEHKNANMVEFPQPKFTLPLYFCFLFKKCICQNIDPVPHYRKKRFSKGLPKHMNLTSRLLNIALIGSEWVLWLLIGLSLVSVGFLVERGIYYYKLSVPFNSMLTELLRLMRTKNYKAALEKAKSTHGVEARIATVGLSEAEAGPEAVADAMTGEKVAIKLKLERGLSLLGTLGSNAPFIGLFGTVLGIIKAFHDLNNNAGKGMSGIMSGISEALIATGAGLLVAIPAVMGYNFYNRRVRALTGQMEIVEQSILTAIRRKPMVVEDTADNSVALVKAAHPAMSSSLIEDLSAIKPAEPAPSSPPIAQDDEDAAERRARPRRTAAATKATTTRSPARKTTKQTSTRVADQSSEGEEG